MRGNDKIINIVIPYSFARVCYICLPADVPSYDGVLRFAVRQVGVPPTGFEILDFRFEILNLWIHESFNRLN
jgi:hypothetical protein